MPISNLLICRPAAPKTHAAPLISAPAATLDPFPFQTEMVDRTEKMIHNGQRRILWIAAPSAGKTRMSAMISKGFVQRRQRTAFVVEMNSLAAQAAEDYAELGLPTTSYWAGKKYDPDAAIVIVSAQTLESRIKRTGKPAAELLGPLDLIIGDEAHTTTQRRGWAALMDSYPQSQILGMTGTPWNSGDKSLHYHFDSCVEAPQPPDLIKMGRLVPVRGFSPKDLFDASVLKWDKAGDDFDATAQQEAAMDSDLLKFTLKKYQEYGEGRSTIAYCTGISHAKALAAIFNAADIPAEVQIGSTSTNERNAQKQRMMAGATRVLFTVGTCTKGYNLPIASCILLPRAIGNKNLYHQTVCRGNRAYTCPATGQRKNDCILIDLGGNIERFGHLPTDYQNYESALARPKDKAEFDMDSNFKVCPECHGGQDPPKPLSLFLRVCPDCGHEFGAGDDDQEELFSILDYQLEEYFSPLGTQQVQMLRGAKHRLFKDDRDPRIAVQEFVNRFGFQPPDEWHRWAVFGKRPTNKSRAQYFGYLKQFGDSTWINKQMALEFGGAAPVAPFLANWKTDWWEVLGVARNDSKERVRDAYLNLAKRWHLDACKDLQQAKNQMQILNRAWEQARRQP